MMKILSGQGITRDILIQPSSNDEINRLEELGENENLIYASRRKMIVRDLLFESYGEHPVTYGDVTDTVSYTPLETILTHKEDHGRCESLDYIFLMEDEKTEPNSTEVQVTKVERFFVEDTSLSFTQLSGILSF